MAGWGCFCSQAKWQSQVQGEDFGKWVPGSPSVGLLRGEDGTDGESQLLPTSLAWSGTELYLTRGKDTFSNSTKSP